MGMTLKFKPDLDKYTKVLGDAWLNHSPIVDTCERFLLEIGNEHDEWLKSQMVVYGSYSEIHSVFTTKSLDDDAHARCTHQAYLVDVTELHKECEHWAASKTGGGITRWEEYCHKCDAKLKPTGWEIVE